MTVKSATPVSAPVRERSPLRIWRRATGLWRVVPILGVGLIAVGVLQVLHLIGFIHPLIAPSPFTVLHEMVVQAPTAFLWQNMWVTVQESLLAFAIGSGIGFVFGAAIGVFALAYRAAYPYVVLIQSMPRIALAPVFIAVFGFGMASKILTAVSIAFFPVLINTMVGIREADDDAIMLLKAMNASRLSTFRRLMLPGALPAIMGGLKTAMTLAFVGAIVGELVAANSGMGMLISTATNQLRMADVYAYILWIAVITVIFFMALEFIDSKLIFWKEDHRG